MMHAAVMYGPGDVRFEQRPEPTIESPSDAIIKVVAACVCGSDLWRWRGLNDVPEPTPMGHEYVGIVEQVGSAVRTVQPGQFVIGSFVISDNTCPLCLEGWQSSCVNRSFMTNGQAEYCRIPYADGTLVATPSMPDAALIPSLLTLSDVMGTGWWAVLAASVSPGQTVAVVGDGAVGLCAVIAARQMGAQRVIIASRHPDRAALAREFGATDIIDGRGAEAIAQVKDLTDGLGAPAVLECVGTNEAMSQAIGSARPGGAVGFVGVPHGVELTGAQLFTSQVRLHGGPAPVRRYLPQLIDLVWQDKINPGRVFDLTLPLSQVARAYQAMDQRTAIKVLLRP